MDIVVVGPVPPPVDGRAQATRWLVEALQNDGHQVSVVDTQAGTLTKVRRCLWASVSLVWHARPDRVLVVASGELGLVAEAAPLLATRVRGIATSLIHHSAHYVRSSSRLMRLATAVGGSDVRHVVLDRSMGDDLALRYGIEPTRVVVVDNAGLMPLAAPPDDACRSDALHVSNLSPAKGLAAVLEVAARTGVNVKLVGSVSAEARIVLDEARRRGVGFDVLGPQYGELKRRALLEARCFIFLSSYHHEAQPLVLYEAVEAGCVPVVWRTGWVGEQMQRLGLDDFVLAVGDVAGAARLVAELVAMDDAAFRHLSIRVRRAFEAYRGSTVDQFRTVVE